jgi:magnesium chelatase subunit D
VTDDARLAAQLCAIDPGLGGMWIRGGDAEMRDGLVGAMAAGRGVRKVPVHIDDERLLGGLDLAATLAADRPIARRGLLAEADDGVVVLPMAERIDAGIASRIAAVMDTSEVVAERDGLARRDPARFTLALFDDGVEDERAPDVLAERVAFWADLRNSSHNHRHAELVSASIPSKGQPSQDGRWTLKQVQGDVSVLVNDDALATIATAASAFGVQSARSSLFTLRAAKALATLANRAAVTEDDLIAAIRLVLIPRATQMPVPPDEAPEPESAPQSSSDQTRPMEDVVLDAVRATLPPNLIAAIAENGRRSAASKGRGTGAKLRAQLRGRPVGVRTGLPRGGNRLSLIETLRAAAPWQKLRREPGDTRVRIRRDDLRIKRFQARAETTTIFVVDASGSSAAARLAEAKGAVELLLADAYVKRAQVALIAFRGNGADLLLPPTRSLTRARRALAELPGGGGTPLAAGLAMAGEVASAVRAKDRTPYVVVLTDGRGNVALDGGTDPVMARTDAEAAAKRINAPSVLIDISARPREEGRAIAALMGGRFVALPRGDAAALSQTVRAS